jgi:basic membrane lipoprotein Med (substrate-binding protein (PBP1-ABC) superfamily)
MREYAEGGVNLVVGEAFGISREARKVADDYPAVAFLMGDPGGPHGSNFSVFDNWIHEPCYLMGVVAGTMTKTNKIGMVGGHAIGEVNRLFHAFMAGARSVNPDVEFKVSFIGSWYDPPKAKEFALAQVESGVDVLYAERAGVVDAAREKGIIAFGNVNDMNKLENGTGVVVASALWHMEPAIDYAIAQVKAGTFKAEDYKDWTMMKAGGATLSPFYEFDGKIPAEARARIETLEQEIKAGDLVVEINDNEPKSTF